MSRTARRLAVFLTFALGAISAHAAAAQDRSVPRPEPRPATNPLEGNALAISNGAAMFRNRCAGCHGPDAHGYLGPDLTSYWSAGGTDARMFDIVRRGVPGTEMIGADPQRVLDKDIWQMLAYIRTLSAVARSGADRGRRQWRARLQGELRQLSPGQRTRRATRSRSLAHRIGEAACRTLEQDSRIERCHQARIRAGDAGDPRRRAHSRRQEERRRVLDSDHGRARAPPGISSRRT